MTLQHLGHVWNLCRPTVKLDLQHIPVLMPDFSVHLGSVSFRFLGNVVGVVSAYSAEAL